MPKIILNVADGLDRSTAMAFFCAVLKKYDEQTIAPRQEYPVLFTWGGMLMVFKVSKSGSMIFKIQKDGLNA